MTALSPLAEHYLQLAKNPINDGDFAGADMRYSGEFETLEDELEKAASLHQTEAIDWQKIRDLSEALLRHHSKDLRAACWMTWALYQREGLAGLQAGLGLLHLLCGERWNELHPRKDRTRAAALAWLTPRLEKALAEDIPVAAQLPLFRSLAELLRGLETCLAQRLGEEAPLLLPLCRRLDEQISRASQGQSEPGMVGAAIAQVKQAAAQVINPSAPLDNERDAHKSLRALQDGARPLCAWWLRQKASDLRALRLSRTLLWLPIDGLPQANAEQITALRGLPADKLASFAERFAAGQYADLLVEVEASIARAPFWLDGQRLAWECLQELGAEAAMVEVEMQLALFLQRIPGLEELRYHDGAPFADAETRAWIGASVLPHLQAPSAEPAVQFGASGELPAWELALQAALPRLRKDGLKPAVQQLKQGMAQAQGGRARFFWQLALARLCSAAKKHELAKTQLESLDQTLQASGLGEWEPDLALEVLRLLHNCYELLPQNHAIRERKEEIHRRLCHLDLEVVLD
ncbi:type VI secretion system protein TssA [Aquipseudomonas alcaligenes]|uniref:Type VI secretion-associated protein n=1 Tax=Aquipseudomonas alcaligenes TaxID=43263 RepID=A0AA37FK18_AQUAC|nr:type VI secretion system protein TssA [Pseudomonas alcaligenes]BCR26947.1 type VI secretion-associated protein [Pseudomonas alcaligenes]GIZ65458.1 type VI secretion-associated protein [Pseudomonas alcaligenes]GIZ69792.1 type VI secretion-associated protein [Pseudomonas alcaligenes]GIZ74144.1 type VI secretion-associated protein [Pseudomonas alcaligenes]GIZ81972.1 type VI secretion-associated protein [Pseudomonas alcaligenes]